MRQYYVFRICSSCWCFLTSVVYLADMMNLVIMLDVTNLAVRCHKKVWDALRFLVGLNCDEMLYESP